MRHTQTLYDEDFFVFSAFRIVFLITSDGYVFELQLHCSFLLYVFSNFKYHHYINMSCFVLLFNNVGYQNVFAGYQYIVMAIIYFIQLCKISRDELRWQFTTSGTGH